MALLEASDLSVRFHTDDGPIHAVDGVSFTLERSEVLAIVGESGCGKSVTAMSMLKLLPPTATVTGSVVFDGRELLTADAASLRRIRGREIAFIFQEPMTSLNPAFTIGRQIGEVLRKHLGLSREEARKRTVELLDLVHIPAPERRIGEYPHQLSGGMRQRVMIAMAVACDPKVLIADEPTTALDVTIQAGILDLMRELRERLGTAIILITHDLGVVAEVADEVVVMYAAQVAERAEVNDVFNRPHHPYTWGLLGSLPRLDADLARLVQIPGQPPSLLRPPKGCRFHPRCAYVMDVCKTNVPELVPTQRDPAHLQACHLDEETKDREAAKLLEATMAEAS